MTDAATASDRNIFLAATVAPMRGFLFALLQPDEICCRLLPFAVMPLQTALAVSVLMYSNKGFSVLESLALFVRPVASGYER